MEDLDLIAHDDDGEVPTLVNDLITYVNRDDIDPVSQAAIAHAQFEIVHPFPDGNGRRPRTTGAGRAEPLRLTGSNPLRA